MARWPENRDELAAVQRELATADPPAWPHPTGSVPRIGGCFCCFPRGITGTGSTGDPVWVGAAVAEGSRLLASYLVLRRAAAPYDAGYLALREGPPLEAALHGLDEQDVRPDVLLVNATGRDHPRGAGLALHLGAVLELPTVGVTHRPLLATGSWPADVEGATSPLRLGGEVVGGWLLTRTGRRPLAVHAAWRTTPEVAMAVVRTATTGYRTPVPLREARRMARRARAEAGSHQR